MFAVSDERGPNRPEPRARVIQKVIASMTESGILGQLSKRLLFGIDHPIGNVRSERVFYLKGDPKEAETRARGEAVAR